MKSHVTNAHIFGIGHVVWRWACLEAYLATILTHLMLADEVRGRLITAELGYAARRDLLRVLVEILEIHDTIQEEFDCLIKRMNAAYDMRNLVAHSVWGGGKTSNSIKAHIFKARGKIKIGGHNTKEEEFTPERLHEEAEKIRRLSLDVRQFALQRFDLPPIDPTVDEATQEPLNVAT